MAEVKWIKIITDIFDDEKIILIERIPEGDAILVVWFKLLCLAGKTNNHGVMMLSDKIPYTDEMLATIFRCPLNTVRLALKTFEAFGMIEILDNIITITNWDKHQNLDGMEKIREQNRLRKQSERKRKKLLCSSSMSRDSHVTGHGNVTECHGTDKDIEGDIDIEESKEKVDDKSSCPYLEIQNLYTAICKSFPKLTKLSDARKKAIKARFNSGYTVDDFKQLFKMAEESEFLKGKNKRNWRATFDWLIKDANMAKVLDGNYTDKKPQEPQEEAQPTTYSIEEYENNPVFGSFER